MRCGRCDRLPHRRACPACRKARKADAKHARRLDVEALVLPWIEPSYVESLTLQTRTIAAQLAVPPELLADASPTLGGMMASQMAMELDAFHRLMWGRGR